MPLSGSTDTSNKVDNATLQSSPLRTAIDAVFMSPPWGGPSYLQAPLYDIFTMIQPRDSRELMATARQLTRNIGFYLPRNACPDQILTLSGPEGCEIESNCLNRRVKTITAYFGDLVGRKVSPDESEEEQPVDGEGDCFGSLFDQEAQPNSGEPSVQSSSRSIGVTTEEDKQVDGAGGITRTSAGQSVKMMEDAAEKHMEAIT